VLCQHHTPQSLSLNLEQQQQQLLHLLVKGRLISAELDLQQLGGPPILLPLLMN
jgi:hypothetical protein